MRSASLIPISNDGFEECLILAEIKIMVGKVVIMWTIVLNSYPTC